jgi:hypothetical protein
MKTFLVLTGVFLAGCATRHTPDLYVGFADCYNKQRQETRLAQIEAGLEPGDIQGRRQVREQFWELQKVCK